MWLLQETRLLSQADALEDKVSSLKGLARTIAAGHFVAGRVPLLAFGEAAQPSSGPSAALPQVEQPGELALEQARPQAPAAANAGGPPQQSGADWEEQAADGLAPEVRDHLADSGMVRGQDRSHTEAAAASYEKRPDSMPGTAGPQQPEQPGASSVQAQLLPAVAVQKRSGQNNEAAGSLLGEAVSDSPTAVSDRAASEPSKSKTRKRDAAGEVEADSASTGRAVSPTRQVAPCLMHHSKYTAGTACWLVLFSNRRTGCDLSQFARTAHRAIPVV